MCELQVVDVGNLTTTLVIEDGEDEHEMVIRITDPVERSITLTLPYDGAAALVASVFRHMPEAVE